MPKEQPTTPIAFRPQGCPDLLGRLWAKQRKLYPAVPDNKLTGLFRTHLFLYALDRLARERDPHKALGLLPTADGTDVAVQLTIGGAAKGRTKRAAKRKVVTVARKTAKFSPKSLQQLERERRAQNAAKAKRKSGKK